MTEGKMITQVNFLRLNRLLTRYYSCLRHAAMEL